VRVGSNNAGTLGVAAIRKGGFVRFGQKGKAVLVLLAFLATTVGAEIGVSPLGTYSKTRSSEEHTYGHQIMFWRQGKQLLGAFGYWNGPIEGHVGEFTEGIYNAKTGEVSFIVTTRQPNVQASEEHVAEFKGYIRGENLEGKLRWKTNQAGQDIDKNGLEAISLDLDNKYELSRFETVALWQASPPFRRYIYKQ